MPNQSCLGYNSLFNASNLKFCTILSWWTLCNIKLVSSFMTLFQIICELQVVSHYVFYALGNVFHSHRKPTNYWSFHGHKFETFDLLLYRKFCCIHSLFDICTTYAIWKERNQSSSNNQRGWRSSLSFFWQEQNNESRFLFSSRILQVNFSYGLWDKT